MPRRKQAESLDCPAPECQAEKDSPKAMFCSSHWNQLPTELRDRIAELTTNEPLGRAHRAAMQEAIELLTP